MNALRAGNAMNQASVKAASSSLPQRNSHILFIEIGHSSEARIVAMRRVMTDL
jgi:hypothetical protein